MLKNYYKTAIRNLMKHKLFSALNIFGLATSLSVCLLLIMIVNDQYSYDEFHSNGDQIYRIISNKEVKSIPVNKPTFATTALALSETLKDEYSFIEDATRLVQTNESFQIGEKVLYADHTGYLVDQSFLGIFDFGWTEGDQSSALEKPNSIVLTEELAKKLFPHDDPMGAIVEFGKLGSFTITGLIPDPPIRSHIYFDFLVSYATATAMTVEERRAAFFIQNDVNHISHGLVYVALQKGTSQSDLDAALANQAKTYSDRSDNYHFLFQSQALKNVMPSPDLNNDIGIGTPKMVLYFLMSLGLLLIIAASFNYMNLSIARSIKRSKEIGIRKVIGAGKRDIIIQFLGEAVIIAFISLLVAIVLLELLIPAFYGLDPFVGEVFYLTRSPLLYLVFFCFSMLVGLLAGIFPAFNISSFQPIQSLKSLSNIKLFSKIGIRKALITVQFALSLVFILIVIIVTQQQQHVLNAELGIRTDNLMNIWVNEDVDFDVFAQQVAQINGVENITSSSVDMLVGGNSSLGALFNDNTDSMQLKYNSVAQNYIDFMEIELIAGENFPNPSSTESEQFIILNETAVKRMGYESPSEALNQIVMLKADKNIGVKVIGVAKDFHHDNVWFNPIQPFALRQGKRFQNKLEVRINEAGAPATISAIHKTWEKLSPKNSINAYFTDSRMYHLQKFFKMGSRIIGFIGLLTILISCLGLLGMVIYTVEGRLKEIGIRKVLGASESSLNWHLSKGFLLLICLAILFAIPLTIFAGNLWLQNFVIRISIGPKIIFMGVGILLLLAMITVASQTFIAVRSNPVDVLKNE